MPEPCQAVFKWLILRIHWFQDGWLAKTQIDDYQKQYEQAVTAAKQKAEAAAAFKPSPNEGKWLADIYRLARLRLARAGVTAVYGGEHCTFSDSEQFYSYRRNGQTGRMASIIWLAE